MLPTILALIIPILTFIHGNAWFAPKPQTLAVHQFSLGDRYPVASVNNVFKDNILLATAYATGEKLDPSSIEWNSLEKPFTYTLSLRPGQTFAFHSDVLPSYDSSSIKTPDVDFSSQEGFKSDGYLVGDGVCHLASLLYWVAKDAGLNAVAPTRHDFAPVPGVPSQYGTAIYDSGVKSESNELQNLYITNNKDKTITFLFENTGKDLVIKAID